MTTLAELREQVRQRSDMETNNFITDPELTGYINNSYNELYDILVSKFEDYYVKDPLTFTLTSGSYSFPIPSDFYKIRGIDQSISNDKWATIYPFNFVERNQLNSRVSILTGKVTVNYRLMGNNILFLPKDKAAGDYQLWYIPRYTPLVSDSDVLSDVMDFEEYIILDAAIKSLVKQETDPSPLMIMKQAMKTRIESMAANRDAGMTQRIGDVNNLNNRFGGSMPYWGYF